MLCELSQLVGKLEGWERLTDAKKQRVCDDIIKFFGRSEIPVYEIAALAQSLACSGDTWIWPAKIHPTADVPSTGGTSSLTTLLCPYLLAAHQIFVPKLSVAGFTAGAIDTLALLQGFKTVLNYGEMLFSLKASRIAHSETTDKIAPADGYLFRRRAELAKKSMVPLVVSSLLAKKIAASCSAGVLDVRCCPKGNLGRDHPSCIANARIFIRTAQSVGIVMACAVTDHSVPRLPYLGRSENLMALLQIISAKSENEIPVNLRQHSETCIKIAATTLVILKIFDRISEARDSVCERLFSGSVNEVFQRHIRAQGASLRSIRTFEQRFEQSQFYDVYAQRDGNLRGVDIPSIVPVLSRINQAARNQKDAVGVVLVKEIGNRVRSGEIIMRIRRSCSVRANQMSVLRQACAGGIQISDENSLPIDSELVTIVSDEGILYE